MRMREALINAAILFCRLAINAFIEAFLVDETLHAKLVLEMHHPSPTSK